MFLPFETNKYKLKYGLNECNKPKIRRRSFDSFSAFFYSTRKKDEYLSMMRVTLQNNLHH